MSSQDIIQELYKALYLLNTEKEEYAKYKLENLIFKLEEGNK